MRDPDLAAFAVALPFIAARPRDGASVREFTERFRVELSSTLVMLARMRLIGGGAAHPSVPSKCDNCPAEIGALDWFVDGRVEMGPWANLCPLCFWRVGSGRGVGVGQLFFRSNDGCWRAIAGDDFARGGEA